jgi:hypothetical protein
MAQYQRIEYRIGANGKIIETVLEGEGTSCLEATAALESALGMVEQREFLPEYEGAEESLLSQPMQQTQLEG